MTSNNIKSQSGPCQDRGNTHAQTLAPAKKASTHHLILVAMYSSLQALLDTGAHLWLPCVNQECVSVSGVLLCCQAETLHKNPPPGYQEGHRVLLSGLSCLRNQERKKNKRKQTNTSKSIPFWPLCNPACVRIWTLTANHSRWRKRKKATG